MQWNVLLKMFITVQWLTQDVQRWGRGAEKGASTPGAKTSNFDGVIFAQGVNHKWNEIIRFLLLNQVNKCIQVRKHQGKENMGFIDFQSKTYVFQFTVYNCLSVQKKKIFFFGITWEKLINWKFYLFIKLIAFSTKKGGKSTL